MANRVEAEWSPIPKHEYQNSAVLSGALAIKIAKNAEYLKQLIDDVNGQGIPGAVHGHDHTGGLQGAPINRYIGIIPQHDHALFETTVIDAAGAWVTFETATAFPFDIYFFVPHGINRVSMSISYTFDNSATERSIGVQTTNGEVTTLVTTTSDQTARSWSTAAYVNVLSGELNQLKFVWTAPAGGSYSPAIYGLSVVEASTVT